MFLANSLERFLATWRRIRRFLVPGLLMGLACASALAVAAEAPRKVEEVVVRGKAVLLTEAVKELKLDVAIDPEPASKQVVVIGDDGVVTPLLSDVATRALFQDDRLRGRRVEVKARRFSGVPYIQAVTFRVEQDGRFQTPEYYCNICTISVRYPQTCPCCQGDMELRMKPERP
ncbi:hypothetical protein BSF38_03965 [Paludisphaera borealis]|uniref:Uncharacterized protein n=1 Tax=Paludisphaera borealis TaxID=1387353 RepID=A0A1U7CU13_9BACT|nr:hypothetical protein BSF38_03965 [Paludisphaera borealis]